MSRRRRLSSGGSHRRRSRSGGSPERASGGGEGGVRGRGGDGGRGGGKGNGGVVGIKREADSGARRGRVDRSGSQSPTPRRHSTHGTQGKKHILVR